MADIPQVRETVLRLRQALAAGSDAKSFNRAAEIAQTTGSLAARTLPLQPPGSVPREFHEKLLDVLAQRQQTLAASLANSDTPGYKATDIDLVGAAQQLLANRAAPLTLQPSAPGHIVPPPANTGPQPQLQYEVPQQAAVDGNTVDLDVVRAKFADNSVRYEFGLDRAGGSYKKLQDLFNNMR